MIERQKHLDAFEHFIELGAKAGDENIEKVGGKFGVTANTIWRWYKEFHWRDRAIIRLVAAKNKAEQDGVLSKEAEIASLLTLVKEKIAECKVRSTYLKALYGTAKDLIENKELEIKSIADLTFLAKAIDGQDKNLIDLVKAELLLIGEPDSRQDQTGDTAPGLVIIGVDASKYPPPLDKGSDDSGDSD